MGILSVPGSNPEEAALLFWRFDFHQDSVPALSVYTTYTHTNTLAARMVLLEHYDSCLLCGTTFLLWHKLYCKCANESTQRARGDLFLVTVILPGYFRPNCHSRVSTVA